MPASKQTTHVHINLPACSQTTAANIYTRLRPERIPPELLPTLDKEGQVQGQIAAAVDAINNLCRRLEATNLDRYQRRLLRKFKTHRMAIMYNLSLMAGAAAPLSSPADVWGLE